MKAAIRQYIQEVERAFHRRAFGDKRARVNLLPVAQRRAYVNRMRQRATGHSSEVDVSNDARRSRSVE